jgi:hypothetical protein
LNRGNGIGGRQRQAAPATWRPYVDGEAARPFVSALPRRHATPPTAPPSFTHPATSLSSPKQTEQPHLRRPRARAPWHRKPPKLAHTFAATSFTSFAPPTSRSSKGEGEFRRFHHHRRGPTSPELELTVASYHRAPFTSFSPFPQLPRESKKLIPSFVAPAMAGPRRSTVVSLRRPPLPAAGPFRLTLGTPKPLHRCGIG